MHWKAVRDKTSTHGVFKKLNKDCYGPDGIDYTRVKISYGMVSTVEVTLAKVDEESARPFLRNGRDTSYNSMPLWKTARVGPLKQCISVLLEGKAYACATLLYNFLLPTVLLYFLVGHIVISIEDALYITLTRDVFNLSPTEVICRGQMFSRFL